MVRLILTTWIKLSQMERSRLSHGQTQVRKHFTYIILYWNWRAFGQIVWSFNSDGVMVVNGQRITAFVSDCLCGIKAITIHALKTGRFMYAERWRKFKR